MLKSNVASAKTIVCGQRPCIGFCSPVPTSTISRRFGLVVRRRRISQGFTQEKLAELCGLHSTYIGLIERGRRNPTLDVCERIAEALGCRITTLVAEAAKVQSLSL